MSAEHVSLPSPAPQGGRSTWPRLVLPVVFVLVGLAGVVSIAVSDYYTKRSALQKLSEDVLYAVEQQVLIQVDAFLSSASSMADFLARLARESRQIELEQRSTLDRVASDLLRTYDQLAMFNIADTTGQFLMPKKMPDGSIDTKSIRFVDGQRVVQWIRRDTSGQVEQVESVQGDTYDPRVRPWYRGAVETGGLFWTDVYIFFTDRKPGVTVAAPVYDQSDQLRGVLGLDIELDSLSTFLSKLRVGENGYAAIISEQGRLVAHPQIDKTVRRVDGELVTAQITAVDDPLLRRAYDRYRLDGPGRRVFQMDDRSYIALSRPLPEDYGQDWLIMIVAPEQDFVGIAATTSRRSLWLAMTVFAVALLLGAGVIAQQVVVDRRARRAIRRYDQLRAHAAGLADLAGRTDGDQRAGSLDEQLRLAWSMVAAPRASLWRIDSDSQTMRLERVCDGQDVEPGGLALAIGDVQGFADLAEANDVLPVADVEHSEQTAGLVEPYLHPADIRSLLAVPVRLDGADKGLLCFEQTGRRLRWTADQMDFARTAAQLFTEDTQGSDAWGDSADPDPADSSNQADHQADPRRQAVARALADSKDGPDKQQASRIDSAAVVVLAFIAEGTVDGSCDASADRQQMIARFVREICLAYDARYHQFHGEQLVLVFQAKAGKAEAVNRAIDAAVCMMEDMPGAVGCEQGDFAAQAGVDLGQVVLVGDFHESADGLRLTGPAVRLATWLARTSSRHMVQLGAAAKEHIGQSYDVHLRGTFLTPEREDRQVFCISTGDINR